MGPIARFQRWLKLRLMERTYVARIYADSLRDNFIGYTPVDQQQFNDLKAEFDAQDRSDEPNLSELLRIEAALVALVPDEMILARFWAVDDRFQRVVPLSTRTRYETGVPPRGDAVWSDPNYVRNQTRALLDVVHVNYLVNIGREESIKRLMGIIALTGIGAILVAWLVNLVSTSDATAGHTLLVLAGIFGAMISTSNRLQTAVRDDAMAQDGVYELTGLRMGWVGMVTSILMGGAFALVLFWIVLAGLFDVAYPLASDSDVRRGASSDAEPQIPTPTPGAAQTAAASPAPSPTPIAEATPTQTPSAADPADKTTTKGADKATASSKQGATGKELRRRSPNEPQVATAPKNDWVEKLKTALGLASRADFYKMLILAFLAGFAERLVPDILGRLTKKGAEAK